MIIFFRVIFVQQSLHSDFANSTKVNDMQNRKEYITI
jgi:hypothetical protein